MALGTVGLGCRKADAETSPPPEQVVAEPGAGAEAADEGPPRDVTEPGEQAEAIAPNDSDTPAEVMVDPSWPTPPEGMVYVPAADVMLGRANDDYRPLGVRHVDAFFIDRHEVTTAAYEACVAARQCPRYTRPTEIQYGASVTDDPIERWLATTCNYGRPERADHPMNCVSFREAEPFCRARGGSLPTFDQWEYAGRGTDQRRYPWGNEDPRSGGVYTNYKDPSLQRLHSAMGLDLGSYGPMPDDGFPETAPGGSFPRDHSPFGVVDMAGNVSEWTSTLGRMDSHPVDPLYGQLVPLTTIGTWLSVGSPLMATLPRAPTGKHPAVGFRCAAAVTPTP